MERRGGACSPRPPRAHPGMAEETTLPVHRVTPKSQVILLGMREWTSRKSLSAFRRGVGFERVTYDAGLMR